MDLPSVSRATDGCIARRLLTLLVVSCGFFLTAGNLGLRSNIYGGELRDAKTVEGEWFIFVLYIEMLVSIIPLLEGVTAMILEVGNVELNESIIISRYKSNTKSSL